MQSSIWLGATIILDTWRNSKVEFETARRLHEESLPLFRRGGMEHGIASANYALGRELRLAKEMPRWQTHIWKKRLWSFKSLETGWE